MPTVQLNKTNARALKLTLERRAAQRVIAFMMNEWERRYIEEPAKFETDMAIAAQFEAESAKGQLPSYGVVCARYFVALLDDLTKPKVSAPRVHKQSLKTNHRKPAKKKALSRRR